MTVASPLRYPDAASAKVMTKRGWWLVVLNVLLPGSAQVVAGNRRLGRLGIVATLTLWALVVLAGVVYLLWPMVIYTIFTQTLSLWIVQLAMFAYVVLWVVLTLDTLRLVRLVKTAPNARAWIAAFSVVLLVGIAGTAGYGAFVAGSARGALGDIFSSGPSVPPVNGRYNIMLLGGDAGPDRQGMRPDSMSVVSVDATTGQAVTIGLPRNLDPVPFPASSPLHKLYPDGYGFQDHCDVDVCQLNSIYTEVSLYKPGLYPNATKHNSDPGIESMRDALEGALGITIQYYVLIDMQGFADLVDALGGVDITVTQRLPIGGDENLNGVVGWIQPGKQHMTGYTAQWYARSRHGTSDYDRMARQRQLQDAILKQINPVNVVTKFQDIAKAGKQVMKTDIPQSMLGYFVDLGLKTRKLPVQQVELVPPAIDPQNPDYAQIHKMVTSALAPKPSTPAP
ncbi:LCP family protein [Diaminobutyricibacter tongyongensis]|uniref:LCP family protein n=1 Tax=Leifsonia tongyongensis TaxID=1268043 RepID=A0A6L9Y134_9MICO|nr:LCP family protein [Diaminobutyricibacter tongyongensis]NEN06994.1 LCP family protein [Diaminobutyricibacter tongyongensis]